MHLKISELKRKLKSYSEIRGVFKFLELISAKKHKQFSREFKNIEIFYKNCKNFMEKLDKFGEFNGKILIIFWTDMRYTHLAKEKILGKFMDLRESFDKVILLGKAKDFKGFINYKVEGVFGMHLGEEGLLKLYWELLKELLGGYELYSLYLNYEGGIRVIFEKAFPLRAKGKAFNLDFNFEENYDYLISIYLRAFLYYASLSHLRCLHLIRFITASRILMSLDKKARETKLLLNKLRQEKINKELEYIVYSLIAQS